VNIRKLSILAALFLFSVLGAWALAGSFQYAKFLTVADIEKVTGLQGVNSMPKSQDADGDLNFSRQDGKLLLSATFLPANAYVGYKSSKEGFKSTVPGVGEEAFIGPAGNSPSYILVFRKGEYAVLLNTELEKGTTTRLPIEHLIALGKIIASRM
jgi:hypothetical protein